MKKPITIERDHLYELVWSKPVVMIAKGDEVDSWVVWAIQQIDRVESTLQHPYDG